MCVRRRAAQGYRCGGCGSTQSAGRYLRVVTVAPHRCRRLGQGDIAQILNTIVAVAKVLVHDAVPTVQHVTVDCVHVDGAPLVRKIASQQDQTLVLDHVQAVHDVGLGTALCLLLLAPRCACLIPHVFLVDAVLLPVWKIVWK